MNKYKHIVFNPHMETIDLVIDKLGGNSIWALSHIVPFNEWKSVAVFEAWDSEADEKLEFGKNPVSPLGTTASLNSSPFINQ
jgi:hypothetical protein